MSSNLQDDTKAGRQTGAGAVFLNRVNLAAQQKVTKANTDKANALAGAHQRAQTKLDAAHLDASDELGKNLQKVYFLYAGSMGQWAVLTDKSGATQQSGLPNVRIAVDAGAKRIYFVYGAVQLEGGSYLLQLMSAGLDGTARTKFSSFLARELCQGGYPALDLNERTVYWVLSNNTILRTDLSNGSTSVVTVIPNSMGVFGGIAGGGITGGGIAGGGNAVGSIAGGGIALDTANKKIYWSTGTMVGVVNYDGSSVRVLFSDGTPQNPLNVLTVDSQNRCFYGHDLCQVWRSDFDKPSRQLVLPPSTNGRYTGVSVDISTQLIYWFELLQNSWDIRNPKLFGQVLLRSPIKLYDMKDTGIEPQKREMFTVWIAGYYMSKTVLVTSTDEASQHLSSATVQLNSARVAAPQQIAQAHQDAAQTRQDAHTALDAAHAKAAKDITAKQQDAVNQRQAAQALADTKHTQAAQAITTANQAAATTVQDAQTVAQATLDANQKVADKIKQPAQEKLDAARKAQQNS